MIAPVIFDMLLAGAKLLATSAAGEFAKGAGKTAFEALKARLTEKGAASVALIEQAPANPTYADLIRAELERPAIAGDETALSLAQALSEAIAALPEPALAAAAIDRSVIRAVRDANLSDIEGMRDTTVEGGQDVNITGVRAPKK